MVSQIPLIYLKIIKSRESLHSFTQLDKYDQETQLNNLFHHFIVHHGVLWSVYSHDMKHYGLF